MYIRPAEWRSPKEIWLAWPYDKKLWAENLAEAQNEFVAVVNALSDEKLVVMVPSQAELSLLKTRLLGATHLSYKIIPFGDIWLRDTMPIAVKGGDGQSSLILPRFNGWGQKYLFDDDRDLSQRVATERGEKSYVSSLVFEGGAIECDGEGSLLTTEQCLLNPNRNPNSNKAQIEEEFLTLFGVKKVIWIKEGLKNDHTDGHIDTIARYIAPATVAVMIPEAGDPNYQVMMDIKHQLLGQTDALGRPLKLLEIPSPGAIVNEEGELMPASYLNFIMGDKSLVVPTYGSPHDDEAVKRFGDFSPLSVVGLSARAILSGGGAFHCMSQEFYR